MAYHRPAHRSIAWSKQKLDELDALLTELDASAAGLKDKAKADADRALDRIRAARDTFRTYVADARADVAGAAEAGASKARRVVDEGREDLEKEWVEAELAFQSFLSSAAVDASVARKALAARVKAERHALDASLDEIAGEAGAAIDAARKDFDTALGRLEKEADKAQTGADKISAAGAEAWSAIREGLKEAHAVHAGTARKVADAFARLR